MSIDAMKQALAALNDYEPNEAHKVATALRAAIEQAQEPVAWMTFNAVGDEDDIWYVNPDGKLLEGWTYKPLYTTPRQWQGLSPFDKTLLRTTYAPMKPLYYDKENDHSVCAEVVTDWDSFFAAIESKLQERNP